jgi:hypothetical protein
VLYLGSTTAALGICALMLIYLLQQVLSPFFPAYPTPAPTSAREQQAGHSTAAHLISPAAVLHMLDLLLYTYLVSF